MNYTGFVRTSVGERIAVLTKAHLASGKKVAHAMLEKDIWVTYVLERIFDLAVKAAGASLRVRSSVMEMLNLRIPNPCIFRVTDEEGGPIETAIYPKVSGGVLYGDSAVFRYARSASDLQMPSGVTTLESLLIHLAAELAGMAVRPGEPLKLFDERHYAVESLRAELADIEKKLSKEKQLNRKYELAKEKQRLQREIDYVQGA